MKRLVIYMRTGSDHVLDFDTDDEAKAALAEVSSALSYHGSLSSPTTIAERLVVIPKDVRSAELTDPPAPFV